MVVLRQDCYGESYIGTRLGKSSKLGMLIPLPRERTVLICVWTISNWLGKSRTSVRLGKLMKDVNLGEPTSFFDNIYFGSNQRESRIIKDIVANYRDVFESKISAGAKEKLPTRASGKPDAETISSWSYDMEGHAKKCVERCCELANKTTQVATPCFDDHQLKEEEMGSVGELSKLSSQIVLKCLFLARIKRLDILWSVNKLARSITKWTKGL